MNEENQISETYNKLLNIFGSRKGYTLTIEHGKRQTENETYDCAVLRTTDGDYRGTIRFCHYPHKGFCVVLFSPYGGESTWNIENRDFEKDMEYCIKFLIN